MNSHFRTLRTFTGAIALALTVALPAAHATTIDFENYGPVAAGNFNTFSTLSENGFSLNALSGNFLVGDNENSPDSGSTAIVINGGTPAQFSLSKTGGGAFSLNSFRASEGRNISTGFFPTFGSSGVLVTGTLVGGGTVSASFALDLIANNNAATDFQMFSLTGFSNLASVTFTGLGGSSGYSFGMDDIVVDAGAAVPEPMTLALLGLGLAGIGAARRRKSI